MTPKQVAPKKHATNPESKSPEQPPVTPPASPLPPETIPSTRGRLHLYDHQQRCRERQEHRVTSLCAAQGYLRARAARPHPRHHRQHRGAGHRRCAEADPDQRSRSGPEGAGQALARDPRHHAEHPGRRRSRQQPEGIQADARHQGRPRSCRRPGNRCRQGGADASAAPCRREGWHLEGAKRRDLRRDGAAAGPRSCLRHGSRPHLHPGERGLGRRIAGAGAARPDCQHQGWLRRVADQTPRADAGSAADGQCRRAAGRRCQQRDRIRPRRADAPAGISPGDLQDRPRTSRRPRAMPSPPCCWPSSSSTWCWPPSSAASCSRSRSWYRCRSP